jgi:hypothetical protein
LEIRSVGFLFGVVGVSTVLSLSTVGVVSGVGVLGLKNPFRLLCAKPGVDFVELSLLRVALPFFWGRFGDIEDSACRFGNGGFCGEVDVTIVDVVVLVSIASGAG